MKPRSQKPIIVCSNDNPRLTMTFFMARSKNLSYGFIWEFANDGLLEIIAACDLEVGLQNKPNK